MKWFAIIVDSALKMLVQDFGAAKKKAWNCYETNLEQNLIYHHIAV